MTTSLIFPPFQSILSVSLISWSISELLDRSGFFDKAKVVQVAQQVQFGIQQWWNDNDDDWNRGTQPMKPKHQFAIGLGCGWMASCFVQKWAVTFLNVGILVYAVSETAHFLRPEFPELHNEGLEGIRYRVRRGVQKPRATLEETSLWIRQHTSSSSLPGTAAEGVFTGVIAGLLFEAL